MESDQCELLGRTDCSEESFPKSFISLEQSRDPPSVSEETEVTGRSDSFDVQLAKEDEHGVDKERTTHRGMILTVVALCFLQALLSWCDVLLAKIYSLPPEVGQFIDISSTEYALLTGWIFMIPYLTSALFIGNLGDTRSVWRHRALFGGTSTAGIAVMLFATCSDFKSLALCTLLLGVGTGAVRPCAYAIITQTCPAHFVTRALGVYLAGPPIGKGAAHLTLWLVQGFGWRLVCISLGGLLVTASVIVSAYVYEGSVSVKPPPHQSPARGRCTGSFSGTCVPAFKGPFVNGLRRLIGSPVFVSLIMASTLSGAGGHIVDAWSGIYFRRVFPDQFGVYMSSMAVFSVLGGSVSSLLIGFVTDKLELLEVRGAKPRVCAVLTGTRLALLLGCLLLSPIMGFGPTLLLYILSSLMHEAAPMVAFLQLLVTKDLRGKAAGIEIALTSIASSISDVMIGVLDDKFHRLGVELGVLFMILLGGSTVLYGNTMRLDTRSKTQHGVSYEIQS